VGVVRFLAHNLAQIIGRHQTAMPRAARTELQLLLEAFTELESVRR
jgi:hypothetical protein